LMTQDGQGAAQEEEQKPEEAAGRL
jgi:hypothetical protein